MSTPDLLIFQPKRVPQPPQFTPTATVIVRVPLAIDYAIVELYEEAKRRGTTSAPDISDYYAEVLAEHPVVASVASEIEAGEAA